MFDHMRGMQLETEDILIGTESELAIFSSCLEHQLAAQCTKLRKKQRPARQQPVVVTQQLSVADELQKLAVLA